MSRYSSSGSKQHRITSVTPVTNYRIHWTVDYYYHGVRQRFPRGFSRDTDRAGALRFAEKWGCAMPDEDLLRSLGNCQFDGGGE